MKELNSKRKLNSFMAAYLLACLIGLPVLWWIEPIGASKWIQYMLLPMIAPSFAYFATENQYINRAFPALSVCAMMLLAIGFVAKLVH